MKIFEKLYNCFLQKYDIGEPPYDYEFLLNLKEEEYPKYLKKIFKFMTMEELCLENPKTFNEKIQWLKLYDYSPLKTKLTDKVLVRDWIKDKIGEEYLKPILQVCCNFDEINFDNLPESFIIKCNHGCKWQYKIKNKQKFLENKQLYLYVRNKFNYWMNQHFHCWAWFELQYRDIVPQIIIEEILYNKKNEELNEYEVYCFNGYPQIYRGVKFSIPLAVNTLYDSNFNIINERLDMNSVHENIAANDILKQAVKLSELLAKGFKFVRVDWIESDSRLYFNEMTFTPMSGFFNFENYNFNLKLGKMLNIKDNKNGK